MDRDGLTVVPETNAARVTELAGEPTNQQTLQRPDRDAGGKPGGKTGQARRGNVPRAALQAVPAVLRGQVASASGTFLQQTAMGWLVLKLTGNAASLGLVLAAGGVPSLLFGPWGGTIADRVDLRRLLIGTQLAFGLLAGLLWALALAGKANVPVIIAISLASGVVSIADSPARQAFISSLVTSDDLSSAVSLNGVVVNSARVVGRPSPAC